MERGEFGRDSIYHNQLDTGLYHNQLDTQAETLKQIIIIIIYNYNHNQLDTRAETLKQIIINLCLGTMQKPF